MAGDWIKLEHTLPDKPEVVQMAAQLGIDQDCVAGKLARLWIWADQNSIDGNAIPVTSAFLDRLSGVTGFAEAMRKVGWLGGREGSLSFPRFDRHNGQTAKSRAETNRRVAKSREKVKRECNANSVTESAQKPLPEKRREENKEKEYINAGDTPGLDHVKLGNIAAAIVSRWKTLQGVKPLNGSLSFLQQRTLLEQLTEGNWDWERAMGKFPLNCGFAPTIGQFLEGDTVREIINGKYDWTKDRPGAGKPPGSAGGNHGSREIDPATQRDIDARERRKQQQYAEQQATDGIPDDA